MGYIFPKRFQLYGLVELSYKIYSTEYSNKKIHSENSVKIFTQHYKLGATGYIYHPKLLIFSGDITYQKQNQEFTNSSIFEKKYKDKGYSLNTVFLPYRPVSLMFYINKLDSQLDDPTLPVDYTTNSRGLQLKITGRKIPTILFNYDYWDYKSTKILYKRKPLINPDEDYYYDDDDYYYDDDEYGEDSENNNSPYTFIKKLDYIKTKRYSIDVTGNLKSLKTLYGINYEFQDYTSTLRNYNANYFRSRTVTRFKNKSIFSTSLQYSSLDIYDLLHFIISLRLTPLGKLEHDYSYEYFWYHGKPAYLYNTEQKIFYHRLKSLLTYRFSQRFRARLDLNYKIGERNGENESSYGFGLNVLFIFFSLHLIMDSLIKNLLIKAKYHSMISVWAYPPIS